MKRDAHARVTPYELGFPGREFAEGWFSAIREEGEARAADTSDLGAFLMLGEVGRLVRELQGEDRGSDALRRYGALVFHAFHFHRAGEPLFLLETTTARYLVDGSPVPAWDGSLPDEAGYLQLPRHLFWVHSEGEGVPEPLDGIFWCRAAQERLALTAMAGVRSDRPGLSILPLPHVPLSDAGSWIQETIRPEGGDFTTTLPGGELDRLYSITTAGELLKLTALALGYRATVAGSVGEPERGGSEGVAPSALPFRRIRLAP